MSRQYLSAARCVNAVNQGASLKSFCSSQKSIGKVDYALAAETIKYQSILHDVLNYCGVDAKSLHVDSGVLDVMLYELLLGKKKIQGGGQVKRKLLEYASDLSHALGAILKKRGVSQVSELLPQRILKSSEVRRYLRINELKLEVDDGYHELLDRFPFIQHDDCVPGLLVLPPGSKGLGELDEVKLGYYIIQDKASCFPSQILMDERRGGDIVDACSAPGNKTSHMAAMMFRKCNNSSRFSLASILALEKNHQRYELLVKRLEQAGAASIVTAMNKDFLSLDWAEYPSVTCVLLDPSCSGSGISNSLERSLEVSNYNNSRLRLLRAFQLKALLHAMSSGTVETIVYSTCSVNVEENESVVAEALQRNRKNRWTLVAPKRFDNWKRRGVRHSGLSDAETQCLIRCLPEDGMNGFFVALFRRGCHHHSSSSHVLRRMLWRPLSS